MTSERSRLRRWLLVWAYMVITLVVPLMLGVAGVWTWEIATGVATGFWLILWIVMALIQAARPERTKRRRQRRLEVGAEDAT